MDSTNRYVIVVHKVLEASSGTNMSTRSSWPSQVKYGSALVGDATLACLSLTDA